MPDDPIDLLHLSLPLLEASAPVENRVVVIASSEIHGPTSLSSLHFVLAAINAMERIPPIEPQLDPSWFDDLSDLIPPKVEPEPSIDPDDVLFDSLPPVWDDEIDLDPVTRPTAQDEERKARAEEKRERRRARNRRLVERQH
jgi:hypothetical protein